MKTIIPPEYILSGWVDSAARTLSLPSEFLQDKVHQDYLVKGLLDILVRFEQGTAHEMNVVIASQPWVYVGSKSQTNGALQIFDTLSGVEHLASLKHPIYFSRYYPCGCPGKVEKPANSNVFVDIQNKYMIVKKTNLDILKKLKNANLLVLA